jgi:hypothetical protein
MSARWLHGFALVAALLLLDVSLTFHNVWPTPAISWRGEISIELAAYLLVSVVLGWSRWMSGNAQAHHWRLDCLVIGLTPTSPATAPSAATSTSYWDLRFIPDVVPAARESSSRLAGARRRARRRHRGRRAYVVLRWALGRVAEAAHDRRERVVLAGLAVLALVPGVPIARR